MAANCPQCGSPVEQDFGVATCSSCAAVLFIDLDGNATLSDSSQAAVPASVPSFQNEIAEQNLDIPNYDPALQELPPEPEPVIEPEPEVQELENSPVFEFKDSEQAQGPMSYSVKVARIDTKELHRQVLEAINDPKFGWDPREVMKSVKDGVLQLGELNPVKASVLVQKLRDLPVEISWTQNVYR